jgi:hypothetical protein
MRFRLRAGVEEREFLQADARLQSDFAYQQPGLLRRTTARTEDGEWLVIDLWRSRSDSEACASRWEGDSVVQAFMALIDEASIQTGRYDELDA